MPEDTTNTGSGTGDFKAPAIIIPVEVKLDDAKKVIAEFAAESAKTIKAALEEAVKIPKIDVPRGTSAQEKKEETREQPRREERQREREVPQLVIDQGTGKPSHSQMGEAEAKADLFRRELNDKMDQIIERIEALVAQQQQQ